MINKLVVIKLQSHRKSILNFHPRVNVIVGESHEGKTALLRAIKLLSKNRPIGAKYFSDFVGKKGTTIVKMRVDKKFLLELRKQIRIDKEGKKRITKQQYIINKKDKYSGFKSSVPERVTSILNMSDLNIQYQLDQPFVLSTTGGQIAQLINEVTGLEHVDDWQSTVNSDIRSTSAEIKVLKSDLKRLKREYKGYSKLDDIKVKLRSLKVIDDECESTFNGITDVKDAVKRLKILKVQIRELAGFLIKLQTYRKQVRSMDPKDTQVTIRLLKRFIENEKEIKRAKRRLESKLEEYGDVIVALGICPFCLTEIVDDRIEDMKRVFE